MKLILCGVLSLFSLFSFSQKDSVLLLNGTMHYLHVTEFSPANVYYSAFYAKKDKVKYKEGSIEGYRVYAVYKEGQETILYKQDSTIGNDRTIDQMHSYILGERHAKKYYNPRPYFYTGIALGMGTMLYDTYLSEKNADPDQSYGFFARQPSALPLLTTFIYTVGVGLIPITLKTSTVKKTYLLQDLDFQEGYEREGRNKKVFGALKGKLIGIGIGFLTYLLVQ